MRPVQARLAAVAASYLVAGLVSAGIALLGGERVALLERWLGHSFELALLLAYAAVDPRLQGCARCGARH